MHLCLFGRSYARNPPLGMPMDVAEELCQVPFTAMSYSAWGLIVFEVAFSTL